MIDFRYHIVSIVSIFLALAVGIVLGYGLMPLWGKVPDGSVVTNVRCAFPGRTLGSTYATSHGSGPSTRSTVAGFMVPAPTSVLKGCTVRHPLSVQ